MFEKFNIFPNPHLQIFTITEGDIYLINLDKKNEVMPRTTSTLTK